MDKLHDYQGWTGRFHEFKEGLRAKHAAWREQRTGGFTQYIRDSIRAPNPRQDNIDTNAPWGESNVDFSHIYRYVKFNLKG